MENANTPQTKNQQLTNEHQNRHLNVEDVKALQQQKTRQLMQECQINGLAPVANHGISEDRIQEYLLIASLNASSSQFYGR